jgi:hypothetical protein
MVLKIVTVGGVIYADEGKVYRLNSGRIVKKKTKYIKWISKPKIMNNSVSKKYKKLFLVTDDGVMYSYHREYIIANNEKEAAKIFMKNNNGIRNIENLGIKIYKNEKSRCISVCDDTG